MAGESQRGVVQGQKIESSAQNLREAGRGRGGGRARVRKHQVSSAVHFKEDTIKAERGEAVGTAAEPEAGEAGRADEEDAEVASSFDD